MICARRLAHPLRPGQGRALARRTGSHWSAWERFGVQTGRFWGRAMRSGGTSPPRFATNRSVCSQREVRLFVAQPDRLASPACCSLHPAHRRNRRTSGRAERALDAAAAAEGPCVLLCQQRRAGDLSRSRTCRSARSRAPSTIRRFVFQLASRKHDDDAPPIRRRRESSTTVSVWWARSPAGSGGCSRPANAARRTCAASAAASSATAAACISSRSPGPNR